MWQVYTHDIHWNLPILVQADRGKEGTHCIIAKFQSVQVDRGKKGNQCIIANFQSVQVDWGKEGTQCIIANVQSVQVYNSTLQSSTWWQRWGSVCVHKGYGDVYDD